MTNLITRFGGLDEGFDDILRGFFVRPVAVDNTTAAPFKVDVREGEAAYTVHADIPGVKKEDIRVSVDGNQVSISAEVKRQNETATAGTNAVERVLKTERHYGKVARSFTLASALDATGAQAKYTDGVLELVLPKKAATSAKQVTIQ